MPSLRPVGRSPEGLSRDLRPSAAVCGVSRRARDHSFRYNTSHVVKAGRCRAAVNSLHYRTHYNVNCSQVMAGHFIF